MRFPIVTSIMLVVGCAIAGAEERKFPYQAIVEADGEYVRSGPGPNFYPTDKMRKGDKVTVMRHDLGGWCMITPPPGSFSWIRAEHVERTGDATGVLKANKVVVHIGSALSVDEFTTIQGSLSKGSAVQILGEKQFPFDDGPKLMYKISPIQREWRWIHRRGIIAADAIQSDPFPGESVPRKKPAGPVAEQIEIDPDAFTHPISTSDSVSGSASPDIEPGPSGTRNQKPAGSGILPDPEAGFLDRLNAIDSRFREMIKLDPAVWKLDEIEQEYMQLDSDATQPSQSRTIALRLDAVSRYQKTQREYQGFLRINEEAKQRDAQLAQLQREAELRAVGGANGTTPQPTVQPQPQPNIGGPIASTGDDAASGNPARPAAPKFSGAGIVVPMSQTFPGGPQFALVAPGGKLLAYLAPVQGVDLKRAANQSMGIIGERSFRQEWGADTITVRGLQPVQLRASR